MKRLIVLSLLISLFGSIDTIAQEPDKTVSITVSGSGKTQEDAKQAALRSAIEQAYGAFISSKTEMLNDQVVADQMASVSSGNIQSYTILNESQLPDGGWASTIKAIVSVSKLKSFVESKGITIEINGGLFATNIKQQILNEEGEIRAIAEMVGLLHETLQIAFEYKIEPGEPRSLDNENKNWGIPLKVTAIANKNMDFCSNYLHKTLSAISLSALEIETYKSLDKKIYPVTLNFKGNKNTFYLRKSLSIKTLNTLINLWRFYVGGFSVKSGEAVVNFSNSEILIEIGIFKDKSDLEKMKSVKIIKFGKFNYDDSEKIKTDFFLINSNEIVGTFTYVDKKSLAEIEKLTEYSVYPLGLKSYYKYGGLLMSLNNKDLIVDINDYENNFNYYYLYPDAKSICENLVLNGFDDWRLPTKNELEEIYENTTLRKLFTYTSSSMFSIHQQHPIDKFRYYLDKSGELSKYLAFDFIYGNLVTYKDYPSLIRPVRSLSKSVSTFVNETKIAATKHSTEAASFMEKLQGEAKMIDASEKQFEGQYNVVTEHWEGYQIFITNNDEKLFIHFVTPKENLEKNKAEIKLIKGDKYSIYDDATIKFIRDGNNNIVSLEYKYKKIEFKAEKVN